MNKGYFEPEDFTFHINPVPILNDEIDRAYCDPTTKKIGIALQNIKKDIDIKNFDELVKGIDTLFLIEYICSQISEWDDEMQYFSKGWCLIKEQCPPREILLRIGYYYKSAKEIREYEQKKDKNG